MFKSLIKDLKQTWKPALLTYIMAIIINLITGWPMDNIIVGIFVVVFIVIILWSLYAFIKMRSNKN